jgi:hypothetical protein
MVADIEIPEVDPRTNKLVDDEKHFFFQDCFQVIIFLMERSEQFFKLKLF